MEHVFLAKIEQLLSMLKWISDALLPMELDKKALHKVELASEEALVNIIRHAYQNRPENIKISVEVFPKSHAEITFTDHGPPFNPLEAKAPDCSAGIEEREIGGLGIHLMRQYMDEVRYLRKSNQNVLTFVIRSSQKG